MDSPFYNQPANLKNQGVFSNMGTPYRFQFSVYDGSKIPKQTGTSGQTYYGLVFGCINQDSDIKKVGCFINKSSFAAGIINVYKYRSGPVVVFSGDNVIGYVLDGGSVLWGTPVTAKYVFEGVELADARTTFLDNKGIEERVLLYKFKIVPEENRIEYVEKRESHAYDFFSAFHTEYTMLQDLNQLYVGVPEKFIIEDLRTLVKTEDKTEENDYGLAYDKLEEMSTVRIEVIPTGTSAFTPTPAEEPIGGGGLGGTTTKHPKHTEFLSAEMVGGAVVDGKTFVATNHNPFFYGTDLITTVADKQTFLLYATITLPKPDKSEGTPPVNTLNKNFKVDIKHVVGKNVELPEPTTGQVILLLCAVSRLFDIYSITTINPFSYKVGGNGIILVPQDGLPDGDAENIALRWNHATLEEDRGWEKAKPLDPPEETTSPSFVSGGKVVVGAKKGTTGLIKLEYNTLTLTDGGGGEFDALTFPYREYDPWAVIVNDGEAKVTIKNAGLFGIDGTWRKADVDLSVITDGFVYGKLVKNESEDWIFTTHFTKDLVDTVSTSAELQVGTVKVLAFQFDKKITEGESFVLRIKHDWIHSGIYIDRAGWEEKESVTYTKTGTLISTHRVLSSSDESVLKDTDYTVADVGKVLGVNSNNELTLIENASSGGGGIPTGWEEEVLNIVTDGKIVKRTVLVKSNTVSDTTIKPTTNIASWTATDKRLLLQVDYNGVLRIDKGYFKE